MAAQGGTTGARTTVLTGGAVWLGPGRRTHAVAVRDGVILALGDAALALADGAEVLDLEGGLLVPGYTDGHCHPPQGGVELSGPAVVGKTSVADVVAAVREFALAHPDLPWIVGGGYDPTLAPDGAFDAAWLDEAVADRPALLHATDHHTVWCNSAALAAAGVDASTPDPADGEILRRAVGTPLGTLREPNAWHLVVDAAPPATPEQLADGLLAACASMASYGVTWMQDAWVEVGGHAPYLALAGEGRLDVRSNLAFLAAPASWREDSAAIVAQRAEVEALGLPQMLTARSIKYFADGVIEAGTAEMLEPYHDSHDHGLAMWQPDELAAAVAHFDALGFQTHIHAIGDAAIRHALDAIEHAVAVNPGWDRRPVITHVQLADPVDLPRFAALGVTAAMQTYWAQPDAVQTELTAPRLGAERADRQYPVATLAALGTRISIASDWPVSTNDPLEAIVVAATRQTADGLPEGGWVPGERLPLEQGILAATAGGAYQGWTEGYRGTIEPGKAADLVWYDRDLTALPALEARTAVVRGTWLDGRRTYTA
jgi:predicted amidohydrolase YtcJ